MQVGFRHKRTHRSQRGGAATKSRNEFPHAKVAKGAKSCRRGTVTEAVRIWMPYSQGLTTLATSKPLRPLRVPGHSFSDGWPFARGVMTSIGISSAPTRILTYSSTKKAKTRESAGRKAGSLGVLCVRLVLILTKEDLPHATGAMVAEVSRFLAFPLFRNARTSIA
jgi:hypothetical protein